MYLPVCLNMLMYVYVCIYTAFMYIYVYLYIYVDFLVHREYMGTTLRNHACCSNLHEWVPV
jgi:hypothetical protein